MPKKSTAEDFVRRAQALHGHRYDYSKTRYTAALVKVTIICPVHGEFQQTPAHHLFGKGHGCPACGGTKKKNTEQFIVDACKIHGDKYDYSKVRYKNAKTKVTIICREHGPFEQKPNGHLMGDGCPACGIVRTQEHHAALRAGMSAEERTRSKGRRTAEEFIADAHRLYGDKYDYGQVKYVNSYTKATIICRKLGHGAWQQTPRDHLHGYGCAQCYADRRGDTTRDTAEGFIARAQAKHGDKYDYGSADSGAR